MTVNPSVYPQYLNNQASFKETLRKLTSANSISVDSQGNLVPSSLLNLFKGISVSNQPRLVELKIMEFLVHGKKWLKPDDIKLIEQLASKTGLLMKNENSFNSHKELRLLINLIAKEILQQETVSSNDYTKICKAFETHYRRILTPFSKQCEQIMKNFAELLRDDTQASLNVKKLEHDQREMKSIALKNPDAVIEKNSEDGISNLAIPNSKQTYNEVLKGNNLTQNNISVRKKLASHEASVISLISKVRRAYEENKKLLGGAIGTFVTVPSMYYAYKSLNANKISALPNPSLSTPTGHSTMIYIGLGIASLAFLIKRALQTKANSDNISPNDSQGDKEKLNLIQKKTVPLVKLKLQKQQEEKEELEKQKKLDEEKALEKQKKLKEKEEFIQNKKRNQMKAFQANKKAKEEKKIRKEQKAIDECRLREKPKAPKKVRNEVKESVWNTVVHEGQSSGFRNVNKQQDLLNNCSIKTKNDNKILTQEIDSLKKEEKQKTVKITDMSKGKATEEKVNFSTVLIKKSTDVMQQYSIILDGKEFLINVERNVSSKTMQHSKSHVDFLVNEDCAIHCLESFSLFELFVLKDLLERVCSQKIGSKKVINFYECSKAPIPPSNIITSVKDYLLYQSTFIVFVEEIVGWVKIFKKYKNFNQYLDTKIKILNNHIIGRACLVDVDKKNTVILEDLNKAAEANTITPKQFKEIEYKRKGRF